MGGWQVGAPGAIQIRESQEVQESEIYSRVLHIIASPDVLVKPVVARDFASSFDSKDPLLLHPSNNNSGPTARSRSYN
jgi:hypothetical protein